MGFTPSEVTQNFFVDSVAPNKRGKAYSITELLSPKATKMYVTDAKLHDANFAFLTTSLAKLHNQLYEPLYFITYGEDIPVDAGGGFVDYVSYYTVDWAGIMNEFRNVMGNNANYVPRVNAGLSQKRVNVYTFEVAYDLRFVELEKMKKITLQKSIQDIYQNAIVAGWDLFVQKVAYVGIQGKTGLFNDPNTMVTSITNSVANSGFKTMSDEEVVSFFNGIFETYLLKSNMNLTVLPDTILVPTFVQTDLVGRMSALYTNTLYQFIIDHNLGTAQSAGAAKLTIKARPDLNTLGTGGHGRIVAYKKDKTFVRIDMPYPMQHYITLPNIDKMSYTSAFVGQVSEIQLPYNTSNEELGIVTYWDFSK